MINFKSLKTILKEDKSSVPGGKSWYNIHTDELIPCEESYHSLDVIRRPHAYGLSDEHLENMITKRFKPEDEFDVRDPEREIYDFRTHGLDWQPEIAHSMHDKGWVRIHNYKSSHGFYVGGNSHDLVDTAVQQLMRDGRIPKTKGPMNKETKIQAHVYQYHPNKIFHNEIYEENPHSVIEKETKNYYDRYNVGKGNKS